VSTFLRVSEVGLSIAIPPGQPAAKALSQPIPSGDTIQFVGLLFAEGVGGVPAFELEDGPSVRLTCRSEQAVPPSTALSLLENSGREIDQEGRSLRANQHVPVMQVSLSHAGRVDGAEELFEPTEEIRGNLPAPESREIPSLHEGDGKGVSINLAGEAGDPRNTLQEAVGPAFSSNQCASKSLPYPKRARAVVLDHQADAVRLPQQDVRLALISSAPKPERRPGAEGVAAGRRHRQWPLYATMIRSHRGQEHNTMETASQGDPPTSRTRPEISEAELRGGGVRLHQKGGWGKADILLLARPEGRAIIKDFGRKSLPVRWYGRWQIRREASIYRRLAGIRGVPAYYGRIGKNAMALEYIEGERISQWRRRELPPTLFTRLWGLIEAIHHRGIVHIDLRKRDNILIDSGGEVHIIDFNAALRFSPGSRPARWLLPILRKVDHFGFLKWKASLAPGLLSPGERDAFRRMTFLRRFWIFK